MRTDQVVIRRAVAEESDRVADLMFRVREQCARAGSIPASQHPLLDMRTWMSRVVFAQETVWVAEESGQLVALLVLREPDWVQHLYIDEAWTGHGLGSRLLELAKAELGGQVQLWTFERNAGARRFYERHGFVAAQRTGGDNEEGEPDVRYVFRP